MKKLLSLVLSIVMAFAISVPAFATSAGPDIPTEPAAYTVTVNEYDVYVAARTASNDELLTCGISENQISLIKSDAIENELLEKSSLPVNELSEMGYDNNQIAKIMMNGCNMGIQSISEDINKYSNASSESVSLAKKLVKAEENFMRDLERFL